ncbi:MAG: Cell division protein FtsA [Candidatus Kapaibacterium sp.]|nr:MAG: Cell division protein FtsA [Candidatus Kapabacteria bacterium]
MENRQKGKESKQSEKISVGLDIGTWKVCAVVLSQTDGSEMPTILGVGITERKRSKARHGRIDNVENTKLDIRDAIDAAVLQSNVQISSVNVGLMNKLVKFHESRGLVSISSTNKIISEKDVQRVLDEARLIDLPTEYQIIHILPQEFIINNNIREIVNPVGMSGSKLEVEAKIVSALSIDIKNIGLCLEPNNLEIENIVLQPLGTGLAVLDEDEMELGVAVVDVGELFTEIGVFVDGLLKFASTIPVGGRYITEDIRVLLNTVFSQAEEIKKQYGHCYLPSLHEDKQIMIAGSKSRRPLTFMKSQLCRIIQARMSEIFRLASEELKKSGFVSKLGAGIVLTGGTMMIEGVEDLGVEVFGMPVRIGLPSDLNYSGLTQEVNKPYFSTAVGLALYGLKHSKNISFEKNGVNTDSKNESKNSFFNKIVEFFKKI